jgi:hypothetical protein
LSLILCLDSRLHAGGYPQYISTTAAKPELNDDNESDEHKFFPLYNKILSYWFPPSEGYDICPKCSTIDDFTFYFIIEHHYHPLLLINIRPPSAFKREFDRAYALYQVTSYLDDIGPTNLHGDRLYGISVIGKRWRACFILKGKSSKGRQPVKGVAIKNSLKSHHPECWNPDITSDASWMAFQSIVKTIKGYVAK